MTAVPRGQVVARRGRAARAHALGGTLKVKRNPLITTLAILMLITISRIHQHFPILAVMRPALSLAVLALGYAVLKPQLLSGDKWFRTWPALAVIGLGIIACLSVVFGISPGRAGSFVLFDYSKVLILAFLLMASIRGPRELYLYIWAYVVATALLVWLSLFVFGVEKGAGGGLARISSGYKYDANDICVVVLIGLSLTLLTFQCSKSVGKWFSLIVLIGIGMTIARTGSRGGFLGLVAEGMALLVCLHSVPVAKRLTFMVVTVGALALSAPQGYWKQMSTIISPKKDYNWDSYGGRRQLAQRAIGYMLMYPVFGIGVNNFPMAEGTISERAKQLRPNDPGIRWMVPHNSYVEAGAEMGIPGGLLWLVLVTGGAAGMYRLSRRLPRAWLHGDTEERFLYQASMYLPAAITGFGISAFFVSFAYEDPVYILAAFMAGMYLCVDRKLRESTTGRITIPGRDPGGRASRSSRGAPGQPPDAFHPPSSPNGT